MNLISFYLERAVSVRAMAGAMTTSDARRTLFMLADQWEALAAQAARAREAPMPDRTGEL